MYNSKICFRTAVWHWGFDIKIFYWERRAPSGNTPDILCFHKIALTLRFQNEFKLLYNAKNGKNKDNCKCFDNGNIIIIVRIYIWLNLNIYRSGDRLMIIFNPRWTCIMFLITFISPCTNMNRILCIIYTRFK